MLLEFGEDWAKKTKIEPYAHKFGDTFTYWSYTPPLGDHAAIYFGTDQNKNDYYFSKNGSSGPLVIQTFNQLKVPYTLWNTFKTDYKKRQ